MKAAGAALDIRTLVAMSTGEFGYEEVIEAFNAVGQHRSGSISPAFTGRQPRTSDIQFCQVTFTSSLPLLLPTLPLHKCPYVTSWNCIFNYN